MSASAKTSSSPGITASSSASTAPAPAQSSTSTRYARTSSHASSNRTRAFSCWPKSRCAIGVGRSPSPTSNASASECAGSVEHTIVRRPCSAARIAVAAATVVLPTPPLPVNRRMRIRRARLLPEHSSDGFDLLFQFFQGASHDQTRRPALHESGERYRQLHCELVVHARRRGTIGLEPVAAIEAAQHVALDELPRKRARRVGIVVLEHVADTLSERGRAVLDAMAPAFFVA